MMFEPITVAMPERIAKVYDSVARSSFDIRAEASDDILEVAVYGAIGDELDERSITAAGVADLLSKHPGKQVRVRINSPGGAAWDAVAIHNALVKHDGPVETIIEGLAGSAATLIAVAGQPALIFENASFFVHKASGFAWGNADLMMEMAEFLEKIDNQIARTYAARTGQDVGLALRHMAGSGKRDGTVFTAEQAKEAGYVDGIISLSRDKAAGESPISKNSSDELRQPYETAFVADISAQLARMRIDEIEIAVEADTKNGVDPVLRTE